MTKKELVKIIREVVKIEVKKQAKEIFINEYKKAKSSTLKSLAPKPKPVKKVAPQKRDFVKGNDALNDVLNETVALSKGDEMDEYPTMGGGTFDSSRASELLGYGDALAAGGNKEQQRNMAAAQTLREKNVNINDVPESLVNALTRDYSELMNHSKMKK
jgi:hypothetical protein|tara:strand:+ start:474 stop:950 length:477 start_codon:yes stop_codon:yes gene_type:complete